VAAHEHSSHGRATISIPGLTHRQPGHQPIHVTLVGKRQRRLDQRFVCRGSGVVLMQRALPAFEANRLDGCCPPLPVDIDNHGVLRASSFPDGFTKTFHRRGAGRARDDRRRAARLADGDLQVRVTDV
jgi:hypothetical protein